MTRKLEIPQSQSAKGGPNDEWVNATAPAAGADEPVRKLSLMFPESDHRATKSGAAARGKTMIAEILELSRARNRSADGFRWPDDVVASVLAQVEADREATAESAPAEVPAESTPARRPRRAPAKRTPAAKRSA